jgi:hypothetical protein
MIELLRWYCIASSPVYYTAALTALYESVAGLIDQHQPIVEKYYGSGNMHTVVARLLRECDRVVNGLYDGWEEERDISRKVGLHHHNLMPSFILRIL